MLPPYLGQLNKERQEVFKKLKIFARDFALFGGTAIMLQIGHRLSYDFDCFSLKPLKTTLLRKIRKTFGKSIIVQVNNKELCLIQTPLKVDVHFVYYPYNNLKKDIATNTIPLAHLDDLAANKAYNVGRRGAWRDYIDLFFFLKWKYYSIDELIKLAELKFGGEFNSKLFLEQLVYFKDLNITTTHFLKESYTDSEIKSFLEKRVDEYVRKELGFG